ncbi:hypothetical protein TH66_03205 [Carbonactinospora thermoautotrophica]|uniref:Uncharacterized protein n=1 Tax=Carbonactinospora thermoautotrophica TaxID=1469144 RepID=A0A132MSR5_9ACTN|nr:hypothetical protein LI90_1793 [Carbonactinospora thermoautotrophica]KWX05272.1 hypothetical protein TH66_03205 [Carbonactinospora thermoautotrophica]KWX08572.1 hypothetical protein TR74_14400 [Carbonactinospora thermoautotrophica]
MCLHIPPCPSADAPDREAARTVACYPEQGWSLLCNGVVVFEDTGELLPNGTAITPHRPTDRMVNPAHGRDGVVGGVVLERGRSVFGPGRPAASGPGIHLVSDLGLVPARVPARCGGEVPA